MTYVQRSSLENYLYFSRLHIGTLTKTSLYDHLGIQMVTKFKH